MELLKIGEKMTSSLFLWQQSRFNMADFKSVN